MGRHSAPDDYGDGEDSAAAAVLSAPRSGRRPSPGRHSQSEDADGPARPEAEGLDVIETVLAADDPAPAVAEIDEATGRTDRIEPVADPILDQPLPSAETTQLKAVSTDPGDAGGTTDVGDTASSETATTSKAAPAPATKTSDLTLLRTDSAARARVIAAVVVPFLLYVGVLLVVDAFDVRTALIWIWIPLITAGIVAGLLLDLAHKAAAVRALESLEQRHPDQPRG